MTGALGTWSAKSTGDLIRANDRLPYLSVLGFHSKMLQCFNAMDPGLVPSDLQGLTEIEEIGISSVTT